MSPMPPPGGIEGWAFFSGFSATIASVVTSRPATEAASCNAVRTTFVGRGAGRMQRVIDAILALLHLDLGGAADADDGHAAGQLRQTLLQLLAVVVRGGFLDLRADLVAAADDVGLLAGAFDDGGVLL